ncbi:MAG: hypothetical protein WAL21_03755, partial [Nitrososphaeraceae archaeon]
SSTFYDTSEHKLLINNSDRNKNISSLFLANSQLVALEIKNNCIRVNCILSDGSIKGIPALSDIDYLQIKGIL